MDYRNFARSSLERAQNEINSMDNNRLHYAALELRRALEALIYQRATSYKEELSVAKLETWQPKQLLMYLMEIDPFADQTSTFRIRECKENGSKEGETILVGTERLLSLREIKIHYSRLSSYIHTPTINQKKKKLTPESIRSRCSEVAVIISDVLLSPIRDSYSGTSASLICEKCQCKIIKRVPPISEKVVANCLKCDASYVITRRTKTQVYWESMQVDVKCSNPNCDSKMKLWLKEYETLGTNWNCVGCGGNNMVELGIKFTPVFNKVNTVNNSVLDLQKKEEK